LQRELKLYYDQSTIVHISAY